jgi:hypothetical protein
MTKNVFLLVVLALALSTTAFADNEFTFTRDGGHRVSNGQQLENGVLFNGGFSQLRFWTFDGDGYHFYTAPISLKGGFPGFYSRFPGRTLGSAPGTLCQAVPEPGELSLIAVGLLGLMGTIRRKVTG